MADVSREAVIWAYRMILGREPESEAVIRDHLRATSLAELRANFFSSPEAPRSLDGLRVGRHQDARTVPVEVSSSPDDLRRMLANIAREWRKFGETDPHWSVATNEEFRRDRIADTVEAFYRSGVDQARDMLNPISRSGRPAGRFDRILDFGCGVGRLTLALAGIGREVVGVDISPAHLALARERASKVRARNVEFLAIDAVEDLSDLSGFDLVVSFVVLQHNPPPVMAELLRRLLGALRPGGVAVIQMPTFLTGQAFTVAEYLATAQPPMEMNALPQHVAFEIADAAGCRVLEVREDSFMMTDIGLSHTFAFEKRGGPT